MSDLYGILGAEPNATPEEVKRAYKARAMKLHPDRGGSAEEFAKLEFAYRVLSDEKSRARYDETGHADAGVTSEEQGDLQVLAGIVVQMAEQLSQRSNGGDGLVKGCIATVKANLGQVEKSREQLQKKAERFEKFAECAKTKDPGARNIVVEMLLGQVTQMKANIAQADAMIARFERLLALLSNYDTAPGKVASGLNAPVNLVGFDSV